MKLFFTCLVLGSGLLFSASNAVFAQNQLGKNEQEIMNVLKSQEVAWNQADLEGFMKGYWESDSLFFIGSSGVNRGWKTTLENYKKGYPNPEAMGKLTFGILHIKKLGSKHRLVIGSWRLDRQTDPVMGHFSLIFEKRNSVWVIIADHSS